MPESVLWNAAGVCSTAPTRRSLPLHRSRERERGFDQAALIARAL